MTVELGSTAIRPGEHLVDFYESDGELARRVGHYLTNAIRRGAAAIVIAVPAHARAFEAEMHAGGIDIADARASGSLILLDAASTLERFVKDGRLDRDAFHRVVGSVVRSARDGERSVCAYGEMVALLWEAGDVLGAIELEKLWNELALELPFVLLCGYRSESVHGPEQAEALRAVCQLHSSVHHAPAPVDDPARVVRADFDGSRRAPGEARHFVRDLLRDRGYAGSVLDDAQLVVTELATNAVVHARSAFTVGVRAAGFGVRVEVHDRATAPPVVRRGRPLLAPSGRGLRIVEAISSGWGVELTQCGKTVWAELS